MQHFIRTIICRLRGHTWTNDTGNTTHGFHDTPEPGSYCKRCGTTVEAE